MKTPSTPRRIVTPPPAQVSARWLLTSLGLLLIAAACCAYLTLCLLLLQGQWQILYHPQEHHSVHTAASAHLVYTPVRFGIGEAGLPELTGWWMPGAQQASLGGVTVLYLHDGTGTLEDAQDALAQVHALGCAVFAIDYRGYGASAPARPSERQMVEDGLRAVSYLVETRHIPEGSLVLWGRGTGATIAAEVSDDSKRGRRLPMVLEEVNRPALELLRGDPRTRLLPLRWLLRDHLDPAAELSRSEARKLFLVVGPVRGAGLESDAPTRRLFALAAGPKQVASSGDQTTVQAFLARATP